MPARKKPDSPDDNRILSSGASNFRNSRWCAQTNESVLLLGGLARIYEESEQQRLKPSASAGKIVFAQAAVNHG